MTTPEPPAGTGADPGAPRLSPLWREDPPRVGDYWLDARLTASPSGVGYVAHDDRSTSVMLILLSEGAAADQPPLDPGKLAAIGARGGDVVVGYQAGDNSVRALTNQIQVILQNAGFNATIRSVPASQFFALGQQPDQRPDLLVTLFNPDAAHPDTWSRIYNYTDAPVNLLRCSVPEADRLLDAGSSEPDAQKSRALFVDAAAAYRDSLCWLNVTDVYDTVAARKGYSNWQHQLPWLWETDFASLVRDNNS